ncbi:hypothetical protein C8R44DRAFT_762088 [Mycena epipterygia]|nr:hypothetical protein C8R44DRAFT_762088 [Mycena epipterygia]
MLSSRPFNLPTDGRLAAKTPGRENAFNRGVMTVHGKGKHNSVAPVQPHTVQPQRTTKDVKNPTRLVTRPLGDRTPFPNRDAPNKFNTPLPGDQKIAKLVLLETNRPAFLHPNDTPDSVARPSSTRKHVRVPHSATKNFETPLTNGNHWDVSELDLVVPLVEEPLPLVVPETDDYGEIEYMPPTAVDTPYTPPFEFALPDYAAVGADLLRLAHSYPYDDTPPVEIEPALDPCAYAMPVFSLSEIQSDDPFLDTAALKQVPSMSRRLPVRAPAKQAVVRSAMSKRLPAVASNKPPVSAVSRRPPSTASTRPPVAASKRLPTSASTKPPGSASSTKPPVSAVVKRLPVNAASKKPLRSIASTTKLPADASLVAVVGPDPLADEDFVFDV